MIPTSSNKSTKILAFLREELGLPEVLTELHVHFEMGDVIRVNCSFIPQGDKETAGYKSFEIGSSGRVLDTTSL